MLGFFFSVIFWSSEASGFFEGGIITDETAQIKDFDAFFRWWFYLEDGVFEFLACDEFKFRVEGEFGFEFFRDGSCCRARWFYAGFPCDFSMRKCFVQWWSWFDGCWVLVQG